MEEPKMRVVEEGSGCKEGNWMRRGVATALLALLVSVGAAVGRAQVLYGTLTGNVTDPSGAALPGATVTAVNVQTGDKSTQTSDSAGIYRFSALLPGTYKVTIEAKGFAAQDTAAIDVPVNFIQRLDAQLKTGSVASEVTVTGAAAILQTDTAEVRHDITSQQLATLPMMGSQGANFQALLRTIPGAGLTAETNSLGRNPQ